jgi:serine/threonine protein kinase
VTFETLAPIIMDEDAVVQQRLVVYGTALAAQIAFFYVAGNGVSLLDATADWRVWIEPSDGLLLTAGIVFGAVAWLCRGRRRSRATLLVIDASGTFLGLALLASVALYSSSAQRPELSVTVALALTLTLRSILVPSRWARTAMISAVASLPAVVFSYLAHRHQPPSPSNLPLVLYPAITLVWSALAVASATLASRVIFGLRERVARAMRLGQYTLEEKIGEGGMGTVFRASHAMLCRPTAVKLLDAAAPGEAIARFEREVRLTSRLAHPNTIAIYDYGRTEDGTFYYAMELLEGFTLEELVRRTGPLPAGRVIHLLRQVCGSLAEAHDAGLVHRDVKPANIIVCERGGSADVVKVLDFGLVKEVRSTDFAAASAGATTVRDEDLNATQAGIVLGTPLYLSPEAIREPHDVDARSDLYAVGCVGYFLLTGVDAFAAANVARVLEAHLRLDPPKPSAHLEDSAVGGKPPIPEDLESLIMGCLEKERDARPSSARALGDALAGCAAVLEWSADDARAWWSVANLSKRVIGGSGTSPTAATLAVDWSARAAGTATTVAASVGDRD